MKTTFATRRAVIKRRKAEARKAEWDKARREAIAKEAGHAEGFKAGVRSVTPVATMSDGSRIAWVGGKPQGFRWECMISPESSKWRRWDSDGYPSYYCEPRRLLFEAEEMGIEAYGQHFRWLNWKLVSA